MSRSWRYSTSDLSDSRPTLVTPIEHIITIKEARKSDGTITYPFNVTPFFHQLTQRNLSPFRWIITFTTLNKEDAIASKKDPAHGHIPIPNDDGGTHISIDLQLLVSAYIKFATTENLPRDFYFYFNPKTKTYNAENGFFSWVDFNTQKIWSCKNSYSKQAIKRGAKEPDIIATDASPLAWLSLHALIKREQYAPASALWHSQTHILSQESKIEEEETSKTKCMPTQFLPIQTTASLDIAAYETLQEDIRAKPSINTAAFCDLDGTLFLTWQSRLSRNPCILNPNIIKQLSQADTVHLITSRPVYIDPEYADRNSNEFNADNPGSGAYLYKQLQSMDSIKTKLQPGPKLAGETPIPIYCSSYMHTALSRTFKADVIANRIIGFAAFRAQLGIENHDSKLRIVIYDDQEIDPSVTETAIHKLHQNGYVNITMLVVPVLTEPQLCKPELLEAIESTRAPAAPSICAGAGVASTIHACIPAPATPAERRPRLDSISSSASGLSLSSSLLTTPPPETSRLSPPRDSMAPSPKASTTPVGRRPAHPPRIFHPTKQVEPAIDTLDQRLTNSGRLRWL